MNSDSITNIVLICIMVLTLYMYCRITKTQKYENNIRETYRVMSPETNTVLKKVKQNHKKINIGVSIGGHIGAHSAGIVASAF